MRFAFKTSPQYTSWNDLREFWSAADDIEIFESGWLFDHFYPIPQPGRDFQPDGPCLEGWSVAAAMAALTTRLRLGVLVTGVHYRNLGVLAKMIATVDHVSNGRLEIGLGAGWNELESQAFGIQLGDPAERSDRLEEACEALNLLLTQETTTYRGPLSPPRRGTLQSHERAAPPATVGDRRQWGAAHLAHGCPLRRPLELSGSPAGRLRPQARHLVRTLRGRRARPERDHAVEPRVAEGRLGGGARRSRADDRGVGVRTVSTWRSCTSCRRSTCAFSSRSRPGWRTWCDGTPTEPS